MGSDTTVFRYSKEKTLAWLKKKIAALAEKLEQEEIYVGRGSRSSMFVESKKQSEITKGMRAKTQITSWPHMHRL